MVPPRVKRALILTHRWVALSLTPIFLAIILSGAVLAVKPMLPAAPPVAADAQGVGRALAKIDAAGTASSVGGALGGHGLAVSTPDAGVGGVYSLLTGDRVGDIPFDPFAFAKSLHVRLLSDAGFLVKIATYMMAGLLLLSPLIMLPRLRATVRDAHVLLGWVGLPLLLLTPLTAVLMTLHVGRADLPLPVSRGDGAVSLVQALDRVGEEHRGDAFVSARRFKAGTVLVTVQGADGPAAYVVGGKGISPMTGGKGLISELHEGTWAGAWSGALNLTAALGLCAMVVTGWWSWLRRRIAMAPARRLE